MKGKNNMVKTGISNGSDDPIDILVVPDPHATPSSRNDRFIWLANYIVDKKPDVIMNIGDHFSMDSLCDYDKGQISAEGRRLTEDLEFGWNALKIINSTIDNYNKNRKYKLYNPRKVLTFGNHEERITRVAKRNPELDGYLGYDTYRVADYGWESYPYMDEVKINGVTFSHCFPSGGMGRPIGGVNACRGTILAHHKSCVFGHSHFFNYSEDSRSGRAIQSLMVGVFVEDSYRPSYAGAARKMWRPGIVMLRDVKDGNFDFEKISMSKLQEDYS